MADESEVKSTYSGAMDAVAAGIDKVLTTASVNAVYGKAVRQGDTLIIPAAEVLSFTGFGMGEGNGPTPVMTKEDSGDASQAGSQEEVRGTPAGGSGGGGGGQTFARPVAVIVAGPDGVEVKPVLDMTKIGLAALTTFGFMFSVLARIRRGR